MSSQIITDDCFNVLKNLIKVMLTVEQIKDHLISRAANLSVMNQLVNTIYVDSNPATVEYTEVVKEGSVIKEIKKLNQYKLKLFYFIIYH